MELYLFAALLMFYILTSFMIEKTILRKIWTSAFILSFIITGISIASIRVSGQDVMMAASELNWYYLLYLFGSLSIVLGIINMWIYRKAMWELFFSNKTQSSAADDDDEDDDI